MPWTKMVKMPFSFGLKLTLVVLCVGIAVYLFMASGIQSKTTIKTEGNQSHQKDTGISFQSNTTMKTEENRSYQRETNAIQTNGKLISDNCSDSLLLSQTENNKRILSYHLPENEAYIQDLFPSSMSSDIPDSPLFITGFSSNHFQEGLALIDNFNKVVKVKYPHFRLHVYDVGLQAKEIPKVRSECNCTVERFKLENYPEHDRILKGYGWKPLVMQYAAKQYRFVIWVDACIRFKRSDLDSLLQKIRTNGLVVASDTGTIALRTLKETFDILHEQPCVFAKIPEVESNFVAIYETDYVRDYVMKPWVRCALFRGCLVSSEDVHVVHPCKRPVKYHQCHRFDQSTLGLILHRWNHAHINDNIVRQGQLFWCCRECKKRQNGSVIN